MLVSRVSYGYSIRVNRTIRKLTQLLLHFLSANLNISKLDSAYDIDPIFHKMSQKFDEGGAKGLLLVNLGVASDGCRIVLDSKEDSVGADEPGLVEEVDDADMPREEGMIDISSLVQTLEKRCPSSLTMESIDFVPQLEELRHTYNILEEEGFVEAGKAMKSKVRICGHFYTRCFFQSILTKFDSDIKITVTALRK